jgi:hypothetical protein
VQGMRASVWLVCVVGIEGEHLTQVASIAQSSMPTLAMLYRARNRETTMMKENAHPAIYTPARCGPRSRSAESSIMREFGSSRSRSSRGRSHKITPWRRRILGDIDNDVLSRGLARGRWARYRPRPGLRFLDQIPADGRHVEFAPKKVEVCRGSVAPLVWRRRWQAIRHAWTRYPWMRELRWFSA